MTSFYVFFTFQVQILPPSYYKYADQPHMRVCLGECTLRGGRMRWWGWAVHRPPHRQGRSGRLEGHRRPYTLQVIPTILSTYNTNNTAFILQGLAGKQRVSILQCRPLHRRHCRILTDAFLVKKRGISPWMEELWLTPQTSFRPRLPWWKFDL